MHTAANTADAPAKIADYPANIAVKGCLTVGQQTKNTP
jgi:hypothetical protein